ncbi:hypothetical protein M2133_000588 [Parabacteroides sp. PF5-6]|nr:hypothetical protein [Parabacteroides sp. PF5-6]
MTDKQGCYLLLVKLVHYCNTIQIIKEKKQKKFSTTRQDFSGCGRLFSKRDLQIQFRGTSKMILRYVKTIFEVRQNGF